MTENPSTTTDASADASADVEANAAADRRASRRRDADGTGPEVRVDDDPEATCAYCGRPFAAEAAHYLHVGEAHADVCTAAERDAYETALAAEDEELFYFHLRVVAALAGLYTVLVLAYMVALGSGVL